MKSWNPKKPLWAALCLALVSAAPQARAGQEIFLSVSPDYRYRVVVHQEILRRVDDRIFFRYPIEVVNTRTHAHFKIQSGSAPFIQETPSGTFQVDWNLVHFEWDKEGRQFFFQLQVIEGVWRNYYVNIPRERALDITPALEAGVQDWFQDHPGCDTPRTTFVGWRQSGLAAFELTSTCGKPKPIPNHKFTAMSYLVLYDMKKEKVVSDCRDCDMKKASKKFDKYWQSTQVTPTPTPDETPGAE